MKKVKRILAIITVILLVGLYIASLVLAIIGNEWAMDWLKVSIYCTFVLPVLIWIYTFIYKMLKGSDSQEDDTSDKTKLP